MRSCHAPCLPAAPFSGRWCSSSIVCSVSSSFFVFWKLTSRHWLLPFVVCSTRCHVLFMVFLPGRRIPLGHPHPHTHPHPHPAHGISLRMHIGLLYCCCVINLMAGKCEHTGIAGVGTRCNCQFTRNSGWTRFEFMLNILLTSGLEFEIELLNSPSGNCKGQKMESNWGLCKCIYWKWYLIYMVSKCLLHINIYLPVFSIP